jgi:hypothetical protein
MMVVAGAVAGNLWAAENPTASADTAAADDQGDEPANAEPNAQSPEAAPPMPKAPAANPDSTPFWSRPAVPDHARQFGLSLLPGSGYRIIVPYKEAQPCGDSSGNVSRRVCTHALPFFLELQLSFGIFPRLDFFSDLRFGLQKDPVTLNSHEFAFSPGFRFWLDQDVALKFYTTAQVVYDYVGYKSVSSSDFGVRNANGLMYDPIKNLGIYVQLGWTMGLVRWFRMELDGGLGVQVRYP